MSEENSTLLDDINEINDLQTTNSIDPKDSDKIESSEGIATSKDELDVKPSSESKDSDVITDEQEYWMSQANKKEKKVVKVSREDPKIRRQSQNDRVNRLSVAKGNTPKAKIEEKNKAFTVASMKIKKNSPAPSSVYDANIIQLDDNVKIINTPILPTSAEVETKKKPVPRKVSIPKAVTPKPENEIMDNDNFDSEMSNIVRRINLVNSKINQEEVKIVKDPTEIDDSLMVPDILNNGLSNYAGAFQINSVTSVLSGSPTILSPFRESPDRSPTKDYEGKVNTIKNKIDAWYKEMDNDFPDLSTTKEQISRALSFSEQQIGKVTDHISALKRDEFVETAEKEHSAESSVQDALKQALDKVAEALKRGEVTDLRYEPEDNTDDNNDGVEYDYREESGMLSKIDEVDGEDNSSPNSLRSSRQLEMRYVNSESGSGSIKTPRSGKSVMFIDENEIIHDQPRDYDREEVEETIEVKVSSAVSREDASYDDRIAAHKSKIAKAMGEINKQDNNNNKDNEVKIVKLRVPSEFIGGTSSSSGTQVTIPETTTLVINTSSENSEIFSSPLFDNTIPKDNTPVEHKAPYDPVTENSNNMFVSNEELNRIEEAFIQGSQAPSPVKEASTDKHETVVIEPEKVDVPETNLPTSSPKSTENLYRYPYLSSAHAHTDIVGHLMALSNSIMNIDKNYENIENNVENYMDFKVPITPNEPPIKVDEKTETVLEKTSIYKTEDDNYDPSIDLPVPLHYQQMNHLVSKQDDRIKILREALASLEEAVVNGDADLFESSVSAVRRKIQGAEPSKPKHQPKPPKTTKIVPTGQFMKPTAAAMAKRGMNVERNIAMSMANNIETSLKSRRVSKSGGRAGGIAEDDNDLFDVDERTQKQYKDMYGGDFVSDHATNSKKKKKKVKKVKKLIDDFEYDIRPLQVEEDLFNNLGGYLEQQNRKLKANKALNFNQLLSKANRDMNIHSNEYADSELSAILNSKKKRQIEDSRLQQHYKHLELLEHKIVSTMASSNDTNNSSIIGYTNNKIAEYQQEKIVNYYTQRQPPVAVVPPVDNSNNVNDSPRSDNERYYYPYYMQPNQNVNNVPQVNLQPQSSEYYYQNNTNNQEVSTEEAYLNYRSNSAAVEDIRSDYKLIQQATQHKNVNVNNNDNQYYNPNNPQFMTYEQFLRANFNQIPQQQQPQQPVPMIRVAKLEPPSPSYSYKSPTSYQQPPPVSVTSSMTTAASSTVATHSSPHDSPSRLPSNPTLPKINFRMSEALLKDPTPFAEKIDKAARNSFVVDSHELSSSPRIINKATKDNKKIRYMETVGDKQQHQHYQRFPSTDDVSDLENDEVSLSSIDTTANNTQVTAGSTKRMSSEEIYYRLKNVKKTNPQTNRASAEEELAKMIKRQHQYDIIANQINVDLNNQQKNKSHQNKLLADNKILHPPTSATPMEDIPDESGDGINASAGIMGESPEPKPKTVPNPPVEVPSEVVTAATKPKKAIGAKVVKKKKKRKSEGGIVGLDDYDSDDFDEIIAQSIKTLDIKPPKAVKPSNVQTNPRMANLRYKQ